MSDGARPRRPRGAVLVTLGLALAVGLLPAGAPEAVAGPGVAAATASADGASGAPGGGSGGGSGAGERKRSTRPGVTDSATAVSESTALDQARRTGARVEVTSLRTETSEVFATPTGALEAREHVRPVRVRVDGGWRPVDTGLRRSADGAVVPGGTSVGLEFSGGGTAPMVRLRQAGRELALSWPAPLPEPRLEGDSAVYSEVLPGVDLRLTAEVDGFAQLLVVKSAAAAASEKLAELRLRVGARGVTVREGPDGTLAAVDEGAGSAVFEAPRPVMWDSSGTAARGTGARPAGEPTPEPAPAGALGAEGKGASDTGSARDGALGREAKGASDIGSAPDGASGRVVKGGPDIGSAPDGAPRREVKGAPDTGSAPDAARGSRANGGPDTESAPDRAPGREANDAPDTESGPDRAPRREVQGAPDTDPTPARAPGLSTNVGPDAKSAPHGSPGPNAKAASDREPAHHRTSAATPAATPGRTPDAPDGAPTRHPGSRSRAGAASRADAEHHQTTGRAAPTPRVAPAGQAASAGGGRPAPVGVAVGDGGGELVLTPDPELLTGGDTVYPVYIDPQWYTPRASSWTVASRYWAGTPQWKFNGDPDAGLGFCGWAYCKPEDTKRLFYQIPTSRFVGRSVLSAEFVVRETHAASCEAREVQLWRTKAISSSTTWNSQNAAGFWADHLRTSSFAYGAEGCAAADAEFEVGGVLRQAAEQGWPSITFGLRASGESDRYGWKRFADDAYLRVRYNRRPTQLRTAQLTLDPGGTCRPGDQAVRVRSLPTVRVTNVTDPDGDTVGAQFQATWDAGDGQGWKPRWTSATTTLKRSGSDFSTRLPTSLPRNKRVDWHARVWDGAQWSPWSYDGAAHGCNLTLDTSVPAGPSITSGQYAASDPEDPEDPWRDGVGRYGTFTIDAPATDVTRYWFGVNEQPSARHTLNTSGGGPQTIRFMPTRPGVNFVTAQAFDAAGNGSEPRTYSFRVRAGQPDRVTWELNEPAGASEIGGTGGAWPADLAGGARAGGEGIMGGGLHLDGVDDHAATASPVLDTGKSFTVAAWARLPAEGVSGTPVVLAQAGNHASGYELYYSSASGGWVFLRHTSDNASGNGTARAAQPACPTGDTACATGRLGTWTHVAGVFDHPAGELRLYVNGHPVASAPYRDPWDARGATYLGAASHYGKREGHFRGALDAAHLFDYQLSDAQLATLADRKPVTSGGRPAKVVWDLDEDASATAVTGRGQRVTGTPHGAPTLGAPGVASTALTLDGTDDHVRTGQPVLDTHQSFALSLWARLPKDRGERPMVAASQAGATLRGFELYHSSTLGWVFLRAGADDPNAPVVRAAERPCPETDPTCAGAGLGEWAHVVAAYDYDAGELKLYVNGTLKATEAFTTPWLARGHLTLGGAEYADGIGGFFRGDLDEVRLYDRVISDDEVRQLFRQRPLVKGRWKLESATGTPATSPDETAARRPLTLASGARVGPGWVDDGALVLDGTDDHAVTSGSPLDTSASFTLAGWARAAAVPQGPVTVLGVEGERRSAVTVGWVPGADANAPGRWQVTLPATDADGSGVTTVESRSFADVRDWNHLAVVYDGFADQVRLYVNGQVETLVCPDGDGDGTTDQAGCANHVSWADNAPSFNGTRALQVGRAKTAGAFGGYWPGAVDDVWAFQGALNEEEVARLAEGKRGAPTEVPRD
ncbi:LamG-like jellyroll fold domain-containing protein [Streptomyces sp. NPDC057702]|uniref:LamG-like jellyroll fold domain-containing protein n=1 Tax=unclassified Streptomyces TaxID=2593676 RepID=UPI0036C3D447